MFNMNSFPNVKLGNKSIALFTSECFYIFFLFFLYLQGRQKTSEQSDLPLAAILKGKRKS